jgi:hypothetical protein
MLFKQKPAGGKFSGNQQACLNENSNAAYAFKQQQLQRAILGVRLNVLQQTKKKEAEASFLICVGDCKV